MIKNRSDDPDIASAAREAAAIITKVLHGLPQAGTFDYGGHILKLDDYGLCMQCTAPIAEAQQAAAALADTAAKTDDNTVAEHIQLAAEYMRLEAASATIRAELHSGHHSEPIVNELLAFSYARKLHDTYEHSHNKDA